MTGCPGVATCGRPCGGGRWSTRLTYCYSITVTRRSTIGSPSGGGWNSECDENIHVCDTPLHATLLQPTALASLYLACLEVACDIWFSVHTASQPSVLPATCSVCYCAASGGECDNCCPRLHLFWHRYNLVTTAMDLPLEDICCTTVVLPPPLTAVHTACLYRPHCYVQCLPAYTSYLPHTAWACHTTYTACLHLPSCSIPTTSAATHLPVVWYLEVTLSYTFFLEDAQTPSCLPCLPWFKHLSLGISLSFHYSLPLMGKW